MPDSDGLQSALDALVRGSHADPFALLGPHQVQGERRVRVFEPGAETVTLTDQHGKSLSAMRRVHAGGLFEAVLPPRLRHYRYAVQRAGTEAVLREDPYRFPSLLGDLDLHLLREGAHQHIHEKLGAHCIRLEGVAGTVFSVWAPNASRVSVIGDFNDWDGRRHIMRLHPGNGLWEIFLPGVGPGAHYKFEMLDARGRLLPFKSDPLGQYFEPPPGNASIVYQSRHRWRDERWTSACSAEPHLNQPVSIYEVHLGSWRRQADTNQVLDYRQIARQLVTYVTDMGFTHVEFLPVSEHPFDGSWGYQPIGLYAPTQRFGTPDDFRYLVDRLHQAGIGVILDWVPAHFPRDEHGLRRFDGSYLYEHEDPRRGEHADWGTLIFNLGRREVFNYLLGNALYWIESFHIDALRVDAVASMLYLDYSRKKGEWLPNEHGGNENLEAMAFLRELNRQIHLRRANSFAEESTAWPGVSRPVESGGLGFTYKWNMGWMNDTLSYMSEEPVHRKYHHDKMTFGLIYAFTENFVLPLSHDEVVHGKGSLLGKMPGDKWQKFANLRAYFGFMFAHPGKKLLFMGGEFAQQREWSHDRSLDWHLLERTEHRGMQRLVQALNGVYRKTAALYEQDFGPEGFEWIDAGDRDSSIFSWVRWSTGGDPLLCICNFTPVVRHEYRIGVPRDGKWKLHMNTDAVAYGGSGAMVPEQLQSSRLAANGHRDSIELTLPPLSTVYLTWSGRD